MNAAPGWLIARPIAHRGLHDLRRGIVENSLAAAMAAAEHGFAIECDVQRTSDDGVAVFHDFTLDRLTRNSGRLDALALAQVRQIELAGTGEVIPSLGDFLAAVGGRVPVVCEIKSRFDGDMRLCERVADIAEQFAGPIALKSFDPAVIAHLRKRIPTGGPIPLGIVAEAQYDDPEWSDLPAELKFALANLLHFRETQPDFLSYAVCDLPRGIPFLFRHGLGRLVMTWTVRNAEQRRIASEQADQIVFEGFVP